MITQITAIKNFKSASNGASVVSAIRYPLPSAATPMITRSHLLFGSFSP